MGILGSWFLGKDEAELKAMRIERIEKLAKESDVAKIETLVEEIKAIDSEVEK